MRISGDSPLLDFRLINKMYKFCYLNRYDLITNLKPRTYPKGQSIEIIKSNFYLENYKFITNNYDKEHVTSYLYRKKVK